VIYMVEMDFRDAALEHDWHTWYVEHITGLVRQVPGFTGTQRFRAMTSTPSPWLALHEVKGPEVFESPAYRAYGGPASTGEWKDRHTNWYRNLFDGLAETPDVGHDEHLLLAESDTDLPDDLAASVTWLTSVGLDRTVTLRGLRVLAAGELSARYFGVPGLRVFKPITPKIKA
jgi:hypothetical protein